MKKKLKDLQNKDQVQLFIKGVPVPYPYEVKLLEYWEGMDRISGLHLQAPNGDKKIYSFLDIEKEITMWAGYDVGSAEGSMSICSCCGSVIK